MTRWAGPCSLLLGFGLGGWFLGHSSHVWSAMDHQYCWAFGPLVDHWGVGFGPWWTEKIGLYI
jgi:hypothetical protein